MLDVRAHLLILINILWIFFSTIKVKRLPEAFFVFEKGKKREHAHCKAVQYRGCYLEYNTIYL